MTKEAQFHSLQQLYIPTFSLPKWSLLHSTSVHSKITVSPLKVSLLPAQMLEPVCFVIRQAPMLEKRDNSQNLGLALLPTVRSIYCITNPYTIRFAATLCLSFRKQSISHLRQPNSHQKWMEQKNNSAFATAAQCRKQKGIKSGLHETSTVAREGQNRQRYPCSQEDKQSASKGARNTEGPSLRLRRRGAHRSHRARAAAYHHGSRHGRLEDGAEVQQPLFVVLAERQLLMWLQKDGVGGLDLEGNEAEPDPPAALRHGPLDPLPTPGGAGSAGREEAAASDGASLRHPPTPPHGPAPSHSKPLCRGTCGWPRHGTAPAPPRRGRSSAAFACCCGT